MSDSCRSIASSRRQTVHQIWVAAGTSLNPAVSAGWPFGKTASEPGDLLFQPLDPLIGRWRRRCAAAGVRVSAIARAVREEQNGNI
jgi:hypothetical protein